MKLLYAAPLLLTCAFAPDVNTDYGTVVNLFETDAKIRSEVMITETKEMLEKLPVKLEEKEEMLNKVRDALEDELTDKEKEDRLLKYVLELADPTKNPEKMKWNGLLTKGQISKLEKLKQSEKTINNLNGGWRIFNEKMKEGNREVTEEMERKILETGTFIKRVTMGSTEDLTPTGLRIKNQVDNNGNEFIEILENFQPTRDEDGNFDQELFKQQSTAAKEELKKKGIFFHTNEQLNGVFEYIMAKEEEEKESLNEGWEKSEVVTEIIYDNIE